MYCPVCGAVNTEGAKFCGACGARIESERTAEPTGPTRSLPRSRKDAPTPQETSLGSLMPARQSARTAMIAAVLAVDVGLVIAGVVLMTRPRGGGERREDVVAVGSGTGTGTGTGTGSGTDTGTGSASGLGTGSGTGSGAATGSGPVIRPSGSGSGAGTGTGSAPVAPADGGVMVGAIDARSLDDFLTDAAVLVPPAVEVDAAEGTPPEPIVDAAVVEPAVDADDGEVSFDVIYGQANRQVVLSASKRDRCYQAATKALPADQPLSGQVDISYTVLPTGKVSNVQASRNTTQSDALARCVTAMVEDWAFSRHDNDSGFTLQQTFTFGPIP